MFIKPRFSTDNYRRNGIRPKGNTLVTLFFFFLIGLFLHYRGRSQPVVAFWNDVREIVGLGPSRSEKKGRNPYQAPKPEGERSDESTASDNNGNTGAPSASQSGNQRFDFEKEVDFLLPTVKSGDDIIRREGYTLNYVDQYKDPSWVAYPLLAYETTGDADRKNESFKPDPEVANGTALPSDYTRSGFDRGHLAPAGDFKFSQRMMRETFFMSNITPQVPEFNRGIWKELEDQIRTWAVRDNGLYVVTGPVLKPGLPTMGKSTEVSVPQKFYKVILYCNNSATARPKIRMIGFLLNNEASNQSLQNFVVPVTTIQQQTGIDFFPKLPADLQQKLKNQRPETMISEWF